MLKAIEKKSVAINLMITIQEQDKMSQHSSSSEDISAANMDGGSCSAAIRNPAIKTGRQIQLMQVIIILLTKEGDF